MNFKKLMIIIFVVIIITMGIVSFKQYKKSKEPNFNIPILLYHDFVTIVPDKDPDNFNYINTPQSFEENIKTLLENGYTFMSMEELNNAYDGKIEFPTKPILITMDDG